MIPISAIVAVADTQISCELGDETVILNLRSGQYYGLDPVGATIWARLKTPRSVAEIRDELLNEYEVDPHQCERDLMRLIEKLAAEGLVEIRQGAGG